ncbi:renalase-like [Asterias amurensis]|uniref:renalase-like n=1 Tax=Asterias amurensis TaxID=7602 RepID=UPI003AB831CF
MMPRVLIAGAGATGALCANILRQNLKNKVELVVWDKARGAGGRMSTSRSPDNPQCTADLGAQYITVTPDYAKKHESYHQELLTNGLLQPLTATIDGARDSHYEQGTVHYVTPQGVSSIVKHFLKNSESAVQYERPLVKLEAVNMNDSTQPPIPSVKLYMDSQPNVMEGDSVTGETQTTIKIIANPQEDQLEVFDAVILTMPAPQILQLKGLVQEALAKNSGVKSKLQSVSYSSRYALGLFFDQGTSLDTSPCARYVQKDPCIRWISVDTEKRGVDSSKQGPSLVVHTSVPFGIKYLETDKDEVQSIIMQHLRQLMPDLPEPAKVKCQRWRYSQVSTPYEGAPGGVFLAQQPTYAIVAAGDAFTHSNFDGCISSAETACEALIKYFEETNQV